MDNDDFYIGYLNDQPSSFGAYTKKFVVALAIIVIAFASIFALNQQPFKNGTFELGTLTEIEGVLYKKPYPMLRVSNGEGGYKTILLLGFGKFGAEGGIAEMEKSLGDLEGATLKIQGTLIYFNGKTLFQLEPNLEETYEKIERLSEAREVRKLGTEMLKGEIVDPKCYFGVMKPGYGKIHRSCGVRCVSGGMPPVLVVTNEENGVESYYLLTDRDGKPINQKVLNYIGRPTMIVGQVEALEDWHVLKIDNPTNDIVFAKGESKVYLAETLCLDE